MLKRSLCVLCLVGLMAGAATAQFDWEFEYEGTTVPAPGDGPGMLIINLVNNTEVDFPIGGLFFEFSAEPAAGLKWDLDTGFAWEPWLDGSPDPVFSQMAYFATVNPAQTANGLADLFAVVVPALGSTRVATLELTGNTPGQYNLTIGGSEGSGSALAGGELYGFANVPVGNVTAGITVLPEPATLGLLGIGGLMFLRRRR